MSAAAEDVLVLVKEAKVILITVHQGTDVMTIADIEDHQIVVIVTMVAEASKGRTMVVVEETEGLAAVTVVIEAVTTNTQLLVEVEEMIMAIVAEAPMKGVTNTRRDPHLPTEEEKTALIKYLRQELQIEKRTMGYLKILSRRSQRKLLEIQQRGLHR